MMRKKPAGPKHERTNVVATGSITRPTSQLGAGWTSTSRTRLVQAGHTYKEFTRTCVSSPTGAASRSDWHFRTEWPSLAAFLTRKTGLGWKITKRSTRT